MADEEDIIIDVQGYLSITDMPAYNPPYPPHANTGIPLRPLAAAAATPAPPPPSGWEAPSSWDIIRRLSFNPFSAPPPATVPVPQRPAPTPPAPTPPAPTPPAPTPPTACTPSPSAAPCTPYPPPPPRTPSPAHPRPSASTRRTNAADVARQMAALHVLNRFASNREAADASDAAASAFSAHTIASAPDPAAAEEEATEAEKAFHRELALSMLEGNTLAWPDGRPVTRDGGPLRIAGLVALATGEPEESEQSWADWSRENRWWLPVVWGGGGGDPNFRYFDHGFEAGAEPACFAWGCWYCDCGPGCCNGGGRSARNRRAWTPGNLD
ncbi:hypothetical protein VC83_02373 [Pseudogymnoascus destructans]|uniref:Uncharacterized protein n=2 Tax=Pseudogymnoascus destructans TaxID=655981 RepID=L8FS00_PSED2|nr:uncharacterized protein VC83_02373 [Pseudogymnoascus destructans]ELR03248.1 hypothetical protein GMDG_01231 [Pseudogymnoascus destructans 20631-21]OAF61140.1 hypothetical protein VC83_02373 [Pseudogymnoascus destructans]